MDRARRKIKVDGKRRASLGSSLLMAVGAVLMLVFAVKELTSTEAAITFFILVAIRVLLLGGVLRDTYIITTPQGDSWLTHGFTLTTRGVLKFKDADTGEHKVLTGTFSINQR